MPALALLAFAWLGAAPVATAATWTQASEIIAPPSAYSHAQGRLNGVACPASGSCVAVGEFYDASNHLEAMVVSESDGSWEQASAVELPVGAVPGWASLSSIACTGVGSCVAVGYYTVNSEAGMQPMIVSETGGVWGRAIALATPSNSASNPTSALVSVGCPASGPCVAVGYYQDDSPGTGGLGYERPIVVAGSGESWGEASAVALPSNAAAAGSAYYPDGSGTAGVPALASVWCPASGTCEAIGDYYDSLGEYLTMLVDGSSTTATEVAISEPSNGNGVGTEPGLLAITCPADGACVTGGIYTDGVGYERAMVATQTAGVWGQEGEIAAPPDAPKDPRARIEAVACIDSGDCAAAGNYEGITIAMAAIESGGQWGAAERIVPPPNAASITDALWSVACPEKGACVAAGNYADSSGSRQAMVTSETTPRDPPDQPPSTPPADGGAASVTGPPPTESMSIQPGGPAPVVAGIAIHSRVTRAAIRSARRLASFRFSATGASAFQCELIRPTPKRARTPARRFGSCRSPMTYRHLSAGRYTFLVRGVNVTGIDGVAARRAFTIRVA